MADDIRPYGPGKFDTILDSYVYELTLNGCDAELGDVQESGRWYGLLKGLQINPPFADFSADVVNDLTPAEKDFLSDVVGVIVSEDDQGFVSVDYYTSDEELDTAWFKLETEDAQQPPTEPQESDLTTTDHEKWYQDGKLVLSHAANGEWYRHDLKNRQAGVSIGTFGDDYRAALRKFMSAAGFWPDAWFISDHGNAHLIDLSGE